MALSKVLIYGLLLLSIVIAEAAITPPGIANNPSHATCKNPSYKECYNLVHVCPKFCPDSCTVHCQSCKPICGPDTSPAEPPTYTSPPPPYYPPHSPTYTSPPPPYYPHSPAPTPPTPPTPSPTPPTPTPSPPIPTTSTPNPTPSTPTPTPTPPAKAKCLNKKYGTCYGVEYNCPANCPSSCQVDCVTCKPVCSCDYPGAVCQDPRFIGGDGITFYFHGKKDKDFCLVSDSNLHINAHFIGKSGPKATSRDFTWVQSLGVLFNNHRLFIGAQKTAKWDDSNDRLALAMDGEPIFLQQTQGSTWQSTTTPLVTVTRNRITNDVVIDVEGNFKINAKVVPITEEDSGIHNYGITSDDCFAHLDVGLKFYSISNRVEGVLGKTYRGDYVSKVKMGVAMPVLGGEREYATSSIFATDCEVARFRGIESEDSSEGLDLSSLRCASGMKGAGVVCKK